MHQYREGIESKSYSLKKIWNIIVADTTSLSFLLCNCLRVYLVLFFLKYLLNEFWRD